MTTEGELHGARVRRDDCSASGPSGVVAGAEAREPVSIGTHLLPALERLERAVLARPKSSAASLVPATAPPTPTNPIRLIRGDSIQPKQYEWLWPEWIAAGKLHILAGAPGTGKTTVCLSLAAALSVGGHWPDGTSAPCGDVLIWSGEDSIDDVLFPRLCAMGADGLRVHFFGDVDDGKTRRPFDPARDFKTLTQFAEGLPNPRLLILDPIVSAITGDSHHNAEVRRDLQPLVDFAEATGCAIIGVTHFSKATKDRQPLDRVTGSLGFGAVARAVLGTCRFKDGETYDRGLVRIKMSNGKDGDGYRYAVAVENVVVKNVALTSTKIIWGNAIEGTPEEIYSRAESAARGTSALDAATAFLREALSSGGVPFEELRSTATAAGQSVVTLRRAKERLGVKSKKVGMDGGWVWELPHCSQNAAGPAAGAPPREHDYSVEHDHEGKGQAG